MNSWTSCLLIIFLQLSFSISEFSFFAENTGFGVGSVRYKTDSTKYIYLSFDDGPLNGTENIDSVILAEKLKISVFIIGRNAEESKRLGAYYKMYEENPFVESYNHTYTHANNKYRKFYRHPDQVLADVEKNEQVLKLKYKLIRLPGRNMWRLDGRKKDDMKSGSAAADLLAQHGYRVVGWDIEWEHARNGSPIQSVNQIEAEIANRLEHGDTFTRNHVVILLHDEMFQKKWEESELKQLIDRLRLHPNFVFEHMRFYPDK